VVLQAVTTRDRATRRRDSGRGQEKGGEAASLESARGRRRGLRRGAYLSGAGGPASVLAHVAVPSRAHRSAGVRLSVAD